MISGTVTTTVAAAMSPTEARNCSEKCNTYRYCPHIVICHKSQCIQILIPCIDKDDQCHRKSCRFDQRKHDREENLTSGTAIDRCSLLKSLRKLCKKVRQKPDRQGQGKGDVRNDQTCICIEKLQVFQKKIDRLKVAIVGNMEILKIAMSMIFLPLKRSLASAYAAEAPIRMLSTVVESATIKLFSRYLPNGCFVNTFL